MAGFNRTINAATRDYVSDGKGGTEKTRNAQTPLCYQIATQLNQWWGDPDAGSRLFELERAKSSLRTPIVLRDILAQALQPLVDEGRLTEPAIETDRNLDRIDSSILTTDLSTGEQLDLVELLQFVG